MSGMVVNTLRDPAVGQSGWFVTSSSFFANKSAVSQGTSSAFFSGSNASLATLPSTVNKCALSFILSCSPSHPVESQTKDMEKYKHLQISSVTATQLRPTLQSRPHKYTTTSANHSTTSTNSTVLATKGTRFCIADGCVSLAKHNQRCWRHGGSIKCKVHGCGNRAKSKGVCWSHGGGTRCRFEKCCTIAVSRGFCWAHGGGKRCLEPRCSRPGYERTQNYCAMHYKALSRGRNRAVEYAF